MKADAGHEAGTSLVEVVVAASILLVVLVAVGSTAETASRTMRTNDERAATTERMLRFLQRVAPMTRAGVLSTYRVEATVADLSADRASAPGEWIEPIDGEPRAAIRFQAADGNLALRAGSLTAPIVLRYVRDPAEATGAPGIDDDGNGLIDDGRIVLVHQGVETTVATGVEECSFTLEGASLVVTLRAARRRSTDPPLQFEQVHVLRNN
ncbi:MAG TPA: hypothetical protein VK081_03460 [Planctomycetota bacterium]|nr:hypothetical protein [Planctomycetota bacterium]